MTSILDRHRERFRAAPGDSRAFEALEEHLFLSGAWSEVIELYEHRLGAPAIEASATERAQLLFRMGQICEERCAASDRAAEYFRRALQADPRHRPALTHLRQLHGARGQWDVALQIAEAEIALPMPPVERTALWVELGAIWLDQLDDAEQALAQYERGLEVTPGSKEALTGAARACVAAGDVLRAARCYEQLAEQQHGSGRAVALVELAKLAQGPLEQPERAESLFTSALTEDPRNPDAVEAVARLAAERGEWPALAELEERRFELTTDDSHRIEIALEAGRVQRDHLHDPGAARVWLWRAAELAPEDPRVHEALADLERAGGDSVALATSLQRLIEIRRDDAPISALIEVAGLSADLGEDVRALEYLQRALERAPDDVRVVEALSGVLRRTGPDDELAQVLERRAALLASDPQACGAVLAELGAVYEERLVDTESAHDAYARAFAADPAAPGAAAALVRVLHKRERWDELRDTLDVAARQGPADERASLSCSLGTLLAERYDETELAIEAFEAALALDPTAADAHAWLQRLAIAAGDEGTVLHAFEREAGVATDRARLADLVLEIVRLRERRGELAEALGWVERWVDAAPEDPAALELCARLQASLGRHGPLVATLDRLDPLLQGSARAANRRRVGAAHTAEGRGADAIDAYRSALEVDPEDLDALHALAAELEREERLEELAVTQRRLADLLPDAERATCLDALAGLLADRLGDLPGAIETLRRLSHEPEAAPDVGTRLEALLDRAGHYEELAELLRERALDARDDGESATLSLRRGGVLLDHLDRFAEAAEAYRAVLRHDSASSEARQGLERALRGSGDPAAIADFLAEEMARLEDPTARDRCALERAVLLDETLASNDEAREAYAQLFASATQTDVREEAGSRLEGLLERVGAWAALREHLEETLPDAPDARALHERLGRLNRERFDDRDRAIGHFEAAAQIAPERAEHWRTLAQLYHEAGRIPELVNAMESELAMGPDVGREVTLRSRAGELSARDLGDVDRALAHYERVLVLEPAHSTAAEFLIEHWERGGRMDEVVQLLEVRLAALDGEPRDEHGRWAARRTSLRLRIAGMRAGPLEDLDGAIASLEPALGEIGPQGVVAEPLADLYQRAGYTEDLLELCRKAAAACGEGGERASWYVRQGDVQRQAGRERDAVAAYRQALGEHPEDRDTQSALRDLYRRLGEHEPLARLLEAELSHLAGDDEIPARMELAALLASALARPGDAFLHLRRVLQIDPDHREGFELALELALAGGDVDSVLALLDGAVERATREADRAALLVRRAELQARLPGRQAEAAAAYREALTLDPSRVADRPALREVLESLGDWSGVLDCLYQEASSADGEERAVLLERAADVALEHVSHDASLPWLERLRRERPSDARIASRISDVQRRAARPEALLRALSGEMELAGGDPQRLFEIHLERALILEQQLGSPARAAQALEAALAVTPGNAQVLCELDRLYRSLSRPRERARTLEALLASRVEVERVALHCDIASLYSGPLGEPERAVSHLLSAVESTPRASGMRGELLRSLGEVLRRSGAPVAWARCAEEELRCLDADTPVFRDRRNELRRDLARVYGEEMARPALALDHLRELVDEASVAENAASILDEAEPALLALLRAEANPIELAERLAAHLERRPVNADGWLELGRLRAEKLRQPAAAADAFRRALEHDPDSPDASRELRVVAERLGDWEEVARSLEREIELDGAPRAMLYRRLGDVCWEKIQSTTRASRSYAAALEADPRDFASLRSLQRLLEAMEDWRGALDLYESEIEVLGDAEPERRQAAALRAAAIARDHTDDVERALRAFGYAASIGPLPTDQRAELAELHARGGEDAAFAEVFASWCDDPEARASADDHARLARVLEELGRREEARERIERALRLDARDVATWEVAARLRENAGDPAGAAGALEKHSELVADSAAAADLLRAAELVEGDDLERADALLRSGMRRDPANAVVHATFARVCAQRADPGEAMLAAGRALDLASAGEPLDDEQRLDAALLGGRAAAERGDPEIGGRFWAEALDCQPDHAEALARHGETLVELGDLSGARAALEARLAHAESDPDRGLHLAMLGAAQEYEGEAAEARRSWEAALIEDPNADPAHDGLVRLHEEADSIDDGIEALERWSDAAKSPSVRAERLLRAAEWELRAGSRSADAERHLRDALEADPDCARAWEALVTLLWDQDRVDDALDVATLGLDSVCGGGRRTLALIRARALERHGERADAAEAHRVAIEADPTCTEAVLARARLLRGIGDWRAAAVSLREFADAYPTAGAGTGADQSNAELAEVLQQLGRLLAGPLEDVEGAIDAYRRAIASEPGRLEPRAALAEFLSHRPQDFDEALAQHRALLEADPTQTSPLRSALRIARTRSSRDVTARGLEILVALGVASPHERKELAAPSSMPLAGRTVLADPLGEKVRQLVQGAANEIASALDAERSPGGAGNDPAVAFRIAAYEAEGRITAPALLPLPPDQLAEVVRLVSALVLEPDEVRGDGRLVNAMTSALKRRTRRKLRRLLDGESIETVTQLDFDAWRSELRGLAAAMAVDAGAGDLRMALASLACEDRDDGALPVGADLTPFVAASPAASALLRRVTLAWLAAL